MAKLFQIFLLALTLLIIKGTGIAYSSSYSAYKSFLSRYLEVTKLNTETARKIYTDQQLAKIGVIKDYSALTQARLYLTADKQLEAINEFKKTVLIRQADGFDQTETLWKIKLIEEDYVSIYQRIDQLENLYKNLEYAEYELIRPTYNNILKESVEITTTLEQLNIKIYELLIENI